MQRLTASLVSLGATMAALMPVSSAVGSGQTVSAAPPRCHGATATIVGTPRKDDIRGTRHRDVIVARGGLDTINGFAGNDVICGGPGEDVIRGGPGRDTLDGQQDGVRFGDPNTYYPNRIQGGPGNDVAIESSKGAPDRLTFEYAKRGITADLAKDQVRGQGRDRFKGTFRIIGTPHRDRVDAPARALVVLGKGRDRVNIDRGSVAAGRGDDTIRVRANGEFSIRSGPGDDSISLPNTGSDDVSGPWEVSTASGKDTVNSNVPGVSIYTWKGNDRVETTAPTWEVVPGPGRNTVIGSAAVDRVNLTSGRDTVRTKGGDDVVRNGVGRSNVRLGSGDDEAIADVLGGKPPVSPDTFRGGRGVDIVNYKYWILPRRSRAVTAHLGKGVATGEHIGRDNIPGFERVEGTRGRDRLTGSSGDNVLRGTGGRDRLRGLGGSDRLRGGGAKDRGNGGRGTDDCRSVETAVSCES